MYILPLFILLKSSAQSSRSSEYINSNLALYGDLYIAPQNELHIASNETLFQSGKIYTNKGVNGGQVSFSPSSTWVNATEHSYIDGYIKVYNQTDYTVPVGDRNIFQPLAVTQLVGSEFIEFSYRHEPHSQRATSIGIRALHPEHFWEIRAGSGSGYITLSWNQSSNLVNFFKKTQNTSSLLPLLSIGGFNGFEWEAIESQLDTYSLVDNNFPSSSSGSISSKQPIDFEKYSAFAFILLPPPVFDDLKVTEGLTPNGDGLNDTWIIEGVENYPNTKVYVFNRLGREVFSSLNGYNNDWKGNYQNLKELLPQGPYFFIIDFDNDDSIDKQGWLQISY